MGIRVGSSVLAISVMSLVTLRAQAQDPPAPAEPAPAPAQPAPAQPAPAQPAPAPTPTPAQPAPGQPPPSAYGQPPAPGYAQQAGQPGYGQQQQGYGAPGQQPYGAYAPPPETGVRTHDGFFLRLGLGYAAASATADIESYTPGTTVDGKISGGGLGTELAIGGTPAPGVVIGGAVLNHMLFDPTFEVEGTELSTSNASARLTTVGVLLQFYPNPEQGLFIQAFAGYAEGDYEFDISGINVSSETGTGFAIAGGVGYDFWVGDQWSLGPAARLTYAKLTYDETDSNGNKASDKWSIVIPTVLFGVSFH